MAALALLILPFEWILAAIAAATFHECCHIAALLICRVHIYGFHIKGEGARIETEPMETWQEFCCALAGPAGSFLLLFLRRWFPMVSICGLFQGVYNLLPVYPLDGGRMVHSLIGLKNAEKIGKWTIMLIVLLGVYSVVRLKLGVGGIILLILLTQKLAFRKTPCKDGRQALQ